MAEYSKSAIIKYTRRAKRMTQEELAQFICDPATLSRYENGQLDPADDKFLQLMQRMGESGELYSFPIQCETVELQKKMKKLLYAIEEKDWNRAEQIKSEIEDKHHMSMEYPENCQYIGRIEIILKFRREEITRKEAIEQLEELLKLTIPDYDEFFKSKFRILSETEMMILYNIATYSGKEGKIEKAELIFKWLRQYFDEEHVIYNEKPRYLINTNYANLLGLSGRHDESIQICKEEIQWLIKNNKTNCLFNLYYNIGWNIKKKVEKGLESIEKLNQAKCYVWIAYQLAKNYPEDKHYLEPIREFYMHICQ